MGINVVDYSHVMLTLSMHERDILLSRLGWVAAKDTKFHPEDLVQLIKNIRAAPHPTSYEMG